MKAEFWARVAVSEPDWWRPGPDFLIDFDLLRGHVADAIRAAVDEERERCAEIAESFTPSSFRDGSMKKNTGGTYHRLPLGDIIGIARDDRARVIAAAIRAMKDE